MKRIPLLILGTAITGACALAAAIHGDTMRKFGENKSTADVIAPGTPAGDADIVAATPLKVIARAQEAQSIPWSVDFAKVNFNDFLVIDANEDDCTWSLSGGEAQATYHGSNNMDDWLICPPLNLKGGHAYTLTFTAAANSQIYDEIVEVCYGDDATVEAMTNFALYPTTVSGTELTEFTAVIVPRLTGKTYIGFHGISEPDRYKLRLKTIDVTEGAEGDIPAGVGDLQVVTAGPYDLKATVSFTSPVTTMAGNEIDAVRMIEVTRNGNVIKTFNNPAMGALCEFVDEVPEGGEYVYGVTAVSSAGRGYTMKHTIVIGGVAPSYPEEVVLEELETPGSMRLTWTPVLKDIEGNDIPEGFVKYIITDAAMNLVAQDIKDTSIEFYIPNAEQQFVQFIVAAYTVGGVGEGTMSNMRAVGPAFTSFIESFANGGLSTIMAVGYEFGYVDYVGWDLADNTTFAGEDGVTPVTAYDGDNGFAYMQCEYRDTGASLLTGKITLPAEGPAVNFAIFNQSITNIPDNNLVELLVSEDGDNWDVVTAKTVFDYCGYEQGWHYITEGLQAYAGKTVQIRWQVTVESFGVFLIDALSVSTLPDYDLAIDSIETATELTAGASTNIGVKVLNTGAKAVDSYSVKLFVNDKEEKSIDCGALGAGERNVLDIPYTVSPVALGKLTVRAEVVYDKDMNTANNVSADKVINTVAPRYPYVTDLNGECDEAGNVTLNWSKPFLQTYTPGETEDFESGEDFTQSFPGWIFIDADNEVVGNLNPSTIPGISAGESKASFIVVNGDYPGFSSSFKAHSGDKFLTSLFSYYGKEIDDWAITPELNGASQVISFWARSAEDFYYESMELYYSFGSTNPDDFILITNVEHVPGVWTEYNIPVPNGAKRFAVRNHSTDRMALMLDDFYFADASQPIGIELEGYNIYFNGKLAGTVDADTHTFTHAAPSDGTHTYAVTAVYTQLGESQTSNRVEIEVKGSAGIGQIAVDGDLRIEGRSIVANNLEGKTLAVYSIDGATVKMVESLPAAYRTELAAGIYIVRCGDRTIKVSIR
ncbi:MAG: hypothetical protein HDS69_10855 [Bacteroidales bacterium]|nr:hypothetical protein [Bacteroidales bacterium]